MFWALDLFLLFRVFQPAADRLARVASCFVVARVFLVMAAALNLLMLAEQVRGHRPLLLILSNAFMAYSQLMTMRHCSTTRQGSRSGSVNANILEYALTRHFFLFVALPVLARTFLTRLSYPQQLFPAQGTAWFCGLYFMACTANPPPERVERFSMLPQGA